MIRLTEDTILPIEKLTSVFNDVTNSYKFFWFLSILDEIKEGQNEAIRYEDLFNRMIEYVWYPMDYYLLSFGKSDGFKEIINFINAHLKIDNNINAKSITYQIENGLSQDQAYEYKSRVNQLARWVPFRFIRPFFENQLRGLNDSKVNSSIKAIALSSSITNTEQCPYWFSGNKIIINRIWYDYFLKNIGLLRGFTYWHLMKFLQKNNPNVPGISEKIFKPTQRNLGRYISSWKKFIELNPNEKCIYSGIILSIDFSLDHFIPWSFTTNDLIWNLVPVSKQINSSKGNRLPNLERYLVPFSALQYSFFQTMFTNGIEKQVLEEYCLLFNLSLNDISKLTKSIFKQKIKETITPMEQIATNMGFGKDWKLI